MKVLAIFSFIIIFNLCACGQNLRIMFDPPVNADNEGLTHYVIYKWQGDSIQWQNWQLSDMDSIGILPHVMNFAGPYEFQTYYDEDKIIKGGALGEDSLTRRGKMGLTKFYFHPGDLTEIWIEK